NWRLPTYAWVLSRMPNNVWIQAVLLLLAAGGMWVTFLGSRAGEEQSDRLNGAKAIAGPARPTLMAAVTTVFVFGVVRWAFDGEADLAQEVWAAVVIVISLAAGTLAGGEGGTERRSDGERTRWRWLSVAAGIMALMFRELALPYCLVAGAMAAWKRRWGEAAG